MHTQWLVTNEKEEHGCVVDVLCCGCVVGVLWVYCGCVVGVLWVYCGCVVGIFICYKISYFWAC